MAWLGMAWHGMGGECVWCGGVTHAAIILNWDFPVPSNPAPVPCADGIHFTSRNVHHMFADEVSAAEGDILEGIALIDGWWQVVKGGASGVFPSNYCEVRWDRDCCLSTTPILPHCSTSCGWRT